MNRVAVRLALFSVVLAVVFGAAAAIGAVVKPSRPTASSHTGPMQDMAGSALGLGVADDRYTLIPATFAPTTAGQPTVLRFRVADRQGRVVREGFEIEAQRTLHLIIVRRDLRGYQHLHPIESRDGTWSVTAVLPDPGVYRVFADFQIDGRKHVLAADVTAPGSYAPAPLPRETPTATVDGYEVRLTTAPPEAGHEANLEFTVSHGGRAVAALQPYLGARGHLVALRQGDLAYLHVHPHDGSKAVGVVPFAATFPSAGTYRLFLQFQTEGTVHTTSFTLQVTPK